MSKVFARLIALLVVLFYCIQPVLADGDINQPSSSAQVQAQRQGRGQGKGDGRKKSPKSAEELSPIRLTDNYIDIGYKPSVRWRLTGSRGRSEWDQRELQLFLAGPIRKHLSIFVEGIPLMTESGFFTKTELLQGQTNLGNNENFFVVRGGIMHNLQGAAFGAFDRDFTFTKPFILQPVNGFNPNLSRGVSLEYTAPMLTTGKVFMFFNQPSEIENEHLKLYRARGIGFMTEKVIGKYGLSGLQAQYLLGWNPVTNVTSAGRFPVRFQRIFFSANKTVQDTNNIERANAIFGFAVFPNGRFIGAEEALNKSTIGYGYFVELIAIPVTSFLSTYARYDQLRPANHIRNNTLFAGTVGLALDLKGPGRAYGRMTFDYQLVEQRDAKPNHRFTIGWWPIL